MNSRVKKSVENFKAAAIIGERLVDLREEEHLSQHDVARLIGVSRENYANFETGRTPIKVGGALRFCAEFVVSERWLATGDGPRNAFMNLLADPRCSDVPGNSPFGSTFEKRLSGYYDELAANAQWEIAIPSNLEYTILADIILKRYLELWYRWVTEPTDVAGLAKAMIEAGYQYCEKRLPMRDVEEMREKFTESELCSSRLLAALQAKWKNVERKMAQANSKSPHAKVGKHKRGGRPAK